MFNRRNLRIKVMQVYYGHLIDESTDYQVLLGQLHSNIERSIDLYLVYTRYLADMCLYVNTYADAKAAKHLPTEEDLNVSRRIASNPLIVYLNESELLQNFIKKRKLKNFFEDEVAKKLFLDLVKREKYKEYLASKEGVLKNELEITGYIGKRILVKNDDLQSQLDESFINLTDDNRYMGFVLKKSAQTFNPKEPDHYFSNINPDPEDMSFAERLLKEAIDHEEEIMEVIKPKLKNWEADRIAMIDMALLKLAVTELLYFPSIPVKVTINEYIDISKTYSTPKSREFVNGVLDNLLKTLKEEGKIKKTGRGLLDS